MLEVGKISGLGEFEIRERKNGEQVEQLYYTVPGEKVFLVMGPKTLEVRCDEKLGKVLRERYETVMASRYFGRGGIEIVPSGQLTEAELEDLVRLSYNLSHVMGTELAGD